MKVLRIIRDGFYILLALASMYIFGSVLFEWPFIELLKVFA